MAVISTYADDTSTTDGDKFLTYDSGGTTKLTPASSVNKYLGPGWTIAADNWVYSSFSNSVGVINTNAGANTIYSPGMWVKFSQPTLGLKYGKIQSVSSSAITVQMSSGYTLDNEAITSPYYSTSYAPYGADPGNTTANNVGWLDIGTSVTAVVANGNRSYTLTTAASTTNTLSPGMRLRTTRTVAAPTQCTNLNGSTQYFSKTSPAGMTFTNNFVVSCWIKISSYAGGNIVSRYGGASGWDLEINTTGQILLVGYNGAAANFSYISSLQSVPLNKWVHIAAQLDMASFTATPTTSYIMIDGVDVPASVSRGGTNPTALVQSGDFQIGARNGSSFFPGKIAQTFVSSAKITQANVRTLYSQGLTSALITANSIISAYSLSNSLNDLNTANANNLTANGSATTTNADSPFGGQADGTINATLDYGIVQAVTSTAVTLQVAEGCTIPSSGGISAVSFSSLRSPFGFPGQKGKWSLLYLNRTLSNVAGPVASTWYNVGNVQIIIPQGEWNLGYNIDLQVNVASGVPAVEATLSTSSSSESTNELTVHGESSLTQNYNTPASELAPVSNPSATLYYLLGRSVGGTANNIYFRGDYKFTKIFAENAYI